MSVAASLNILIGMDASAVKSGAAKTASELKSLDARARSVWSGQTEQLQAYERKLQQLADQAAKTKITPEEFSSRARAEGIKLGSAGEGEALAAYRDRMEQLSAQLSSGAIGQQAFARAAGEARGEVVRAAEAAERGANHQLHYQHTVTRLNAQLHSGAISFAQYSHRLDEAREHMEHAEHAAERMHHAVEIGTAALATVGIAFGVEQTFEYLHSAAEAADESAQSLGRLRGLVKATGGAAGYSAKGLREMAEGLELVTNFSHLETEAAQAVLLSFPSIAPQHFKAAVRAVQDISAVQGDLRSNSIALGKALEDPKLGMVALRREGIKLDDSQAAVVQGFLNVGDTAGAQAAILRAVKGEYGEVAASMKSETVGLKNQLDALKESIGGLFQTKVAQGTFRNLAAVIHDISRELNNMAEAKGGVDALKALSNIVFNTRLKVETEEEEAPAARKQADPLRQKAAAEANKLLESLEEQIRLWGKVGTERKLAELSAMHLKEEDLADVRAKAAQLQVLQDQAEFETDRKTRAEAIRKEYEALGESFREQVKTAGMSVERARVWRAELHGVSGEQLEILKFLAGAAEKTRLRREEEQRLKRETEQTADEVRRIKDDVATPAEKLAKELERLKKLRADLGEDFYARAVEKAKQDSRGEAHERPKNETLLKGSAEAFSAILKWTGGQAGSVAKQSLDELRKIYRTLSGRGREERAHAAETKRTARTSTARQAELDRRESRRRDRLAGRDKARAAHRVANDHPWFGLEQDQKEMQAWLDKRQRLEERRAASPALREKAARQRLRLAAEFRQKTGKTALPGDSDLLKELQEIREQLKAQHRTQRNQQQPGVVRRLG